MIVSKDWKMERTGNFPGITNNEQLQNLNLRFEYNYFTSKF